MEINALNSIPASSRNYRYSESEVSCTVKLMRFINVGNDLKSCKQSILNETAVRFEFESRGCQHTTGDRQRCAEQMAPTARTNKGGSTNKIQSFFVSQGSSAGGDNLSTRKDPQNNPRPVPVASNTENQNLNSLQKPTTATAKNPFFLSKVLF